MHTVLLLNVTPLDGSLTSSISTLNTTVTLRPPESLTVTLMFMNGSFSKFNVAAEKKI